jgi:hypothetical protein
VSPKVAEANRMHVEENTIFAELTGQMGVDAMGRMPCFLPPVRNEDFLHHRIDTLKTPSAADNRTQRLLRRAYQQETSFLLNKVPEFETTCQAYRTQATRLRET